MREFRSIRFSAELAGPGGDSGADLRALSIRPGGSGGRDERCAEVYDIQVQGLAKRLAATGLKHVVIGISGGLDSTQALLVCAQAMDQIGYPRKNILAYTMPGFATSSGRWRRRAG